MSRNKDIKLLHRMTGLPYKECRRMMKEHHWQLWDALPINRIIKELPEMVANIMEHMAEALAQVGQAVKELKNNLEGTKIDQIVIDESLPEQLDSK